MANPSKKLEIIETEEARKEKIIKFCEWLKSQGYEYDIKRVKVEITESYGSGNVGIYG